MSGCTPTNDHRPARRTHRALRLSGGLAAAAAAAALAAGCGASDDATDASGAGSASSASAPSGSASAVDAVAAIVDKQRKRSNAFVAPGPAVDASSLRGKTVWFVPLGAVIPVLAVEARGVAEAAKGLGITVKTCDGKLQPAQAAACITQATRSGADGIITDSITPRTVATALKAAADKKIPVVQLYGLTEPPTATTAFVSIEDKESHALAAQWIIADSKGKANVLKSTSVGDLAAENTSNNGGGAEFERRCPDCKVSTVEITPTTVESLTAATSTALLKDPQVDYGLPQFDFLVPLFARGVQQAGRANKMKIVSTNAALSSMKLVKSGKQAADGAANRNYGGWQAMDAYVRLALGEPAQKASTIPHRVFDATNIDSVQLTDEASKSGEWFGDLGYKDEFLRLWGAA